MAALERRGLEHSGSLAQGFRVQLEGESPDADAVFACAAEAGVALTSVETIQRSLEDVFMAVVADSAPEGG